MTENENLTAFGMVFLVAVLCLALPGVITSHLKKGVELVYLPLNQLAVFSGNVRTESLESIRSKKDLIKENRTLKTELQRHRIKDHEILTVLDENARFRKLLDFKATTKWKLILAKIIGKDPSNWWHHIKINLGTDHGMEPNLPVIGPGGGLLGYLSECGSTFSKVILIGSPNCLIPAKIRGTQYSGLVEPRSDKSHLKSSDKLVISNLLPESRPQIGQMVVTSGLGQVYPEGIPIGRISEASKSMNYDLYFNAGIKPVAQPNDLQEVWVLIK
jgi:rod shape-determining protein MreC